MKTILMLASLLSLNSFSYPLAEAKQYVTQVNHASSILPEHAVLNTLLQKEISIDTVTKTMKVRLSSICTQSNICPEMLNIYLLNIKKLGSVIQAEGILPIQAEPLHSPGKVIITIEKNLDNAAVIKIKDINGTSTLIASPLEETTLIF